MKKIVFLSVVYILYSPIHARGETVTWVGKRGIEWINAESWDTGTVPTADDDVIAAWSTSNLVQAHLYYNGSGIIKSLTVGGTGLKGDIVFYPGYTMEVTGEIKVGGYLSPALQVTGSGSSLLAHDTVTIGYVESNEYVATNISILDGATFNISNNKDIIVSNTHNTNAYFNVVGSGSRATVNDIHYGVYGSGNSTIRESGHLLSNNNYLAVNFGSDSTIRLGDGTWTISESLTAGIAGDAHIAVYNGGNLILEDGAEFTAAINTGSTATITIGYFNDDELAPAGTITAKEIKFGKGQGKVVFKHTSEDYEFTPILIGTALVQQVNGKTILTGDQQYTGGTTISGGTLQLGNGGATGSILGDVVNNGIFAINRADDYTFDSIISGSGSFSQLGTGTTIFTTEHTYTGGTTISAGTLQIGDGGTTGSIVGNITNNSLLTVNHSDHFNYDGIISGSGAFSQMGTGTTIFTGDNTYTGGTTISAGTLQLGDGGASGSILGDVVNDSLLAVNRTGELNLDGIISGSGAFSQMGTGTTIFTGNNTYTGGTTISAGILQIGDGHVSGDVKGDVQLDQGTQLVFNRSNNLSFDGTLTGAGQLIQKGPGTLLLNGDNSAFAGHSAVSGGTLLVHGTLGTDVTVASGGSLGGDGTIHGNVSFDPNGATLVGREGDTLTFEQDLNLVAGNNINVALGTPSTQGLFHVKGNLTLEGILNISDLGGFGPGLYRLFDYDGTLSGAGLEIGTVEGADSSDVSVQTAIQHQINLASTMGMTLSFWDGSDPANLNNGIIDGGSGTWNSIDTSWTDIDGQLNGSWQEDQFAIFAGTAGVVNIDNGSSGGAGGAGGTITASGLQFSTDGYQLTGDALALIADSTPIIRVDESVTATIDVELRGTQGIDKTDFGTLILTGENTYSGGTTVREGILQIGDGSTTGSITGDVILARTDYDYGTLSFNRSDEVTFDGSISGEGEVIQNGDGTTTFAGENTFTGGLTVQKGIAQAGIEDKAFGAGRLTVNEGATADLNDFDTTVSGLLDGENGGGSITLGSGTLTLEQDFNSSFSGAISGTGGLTKNGTGTLTLLGSNNYSGDTTLNTGILRQAAAGAFSSASAFSIAQGATIELSGYDTSMSALKNAGTVNFGNRGDTTLTVAGDYTGNDGLLIMNAVLEDDNSKTDRLKIGGNSSGSTTLQVINQGGGGAQTTEGIKIIEVDGESAGTFVLQGDYTTKTGESAVIAGAYAYTLHQNGVSTPNDGDWYLRSENTHGTGPIINPGVPVYHSALQTLMALNQAPTLQQRVGNRYWDMDSNLMPKTEEDITGTGISAAETGAIWGRIEGSHNRLKQNHSMAGMKQEINTFIMQAGVDGLLHEGEDGKLIAGITGIYGKAKANVYSEHGKGTVETEGWGLGGTLTWYGDTGIYVDLQAQAMWYDSDLDSSTADRSLTKGNDGFGYSLSAETGKRINLEGNWSVTPQAQLTWSAAKFDTFNDAWGTSVSGRDGESFNIRLGVSADYHNTWTDSKGQTSRSTVYAIANLYQEFMNNHGKVKVEGVNFTIDNDRTWAGIGAGGTLTWADDKYALYGEGSVNTSLSHFADSNTIKGSVGFKVKW